MPYFRDLPESLLEAEFGARYCGWRVAAYDCMLANIDARIDALRVLR